MRLGNSIGLTSGINTYSYVGGNTASSVDPLGLDTAVFFSEEIFSNPFGHIAIATTGAGIDSYGGTADPFGGSVSAYLGGQLAQRNVQAIILPNTTPAQEAAIQSAMRTNQGVPYSVFSHNCSTAVGDSLNAAGINTSVSILPGEMFNQISGLPGAQYFYITQGSAVPSIFLQFNPGP